MGAGGSELVLRDASTTTSARWPGHRRTIAFRVREELVAKIGPDHPDGKRVVQDPRRVKQLMRRALQGDALCRPAGLSFAHR
jgi:hypothetical protein